MPLFSIPPVAAQAPASTTDAVWTGAAPTDGSRWAIYDIVFSYNAAPAAGVTLVIAWTVASTNYAFTYYVQAIAGQQQLVFNKPLRFPSNTAVTVTLKSGGGSVLNSVYPNALTEN